MIACAAFIGREIDTCTRGDCVCAREAAQCAASIGNCRKCQQPLLQEPHWSNLQMHKRCFDEQCRVNDYANSMVKQDKIDRAEGRY